MCLSKFSSLHWEKAKPRKMDEYETPLLSESPKDSSSASSPSVVVSSLKWILKVVMSVIFVSWVVLLLMYPGNLGDGLVTKWREVSSNTLFGLTGIYFSSKCFVFSVKRSKKCSKLIFILWFRKCMQEACSWSSALRFLLFPS